jgi:hypothetical protein
MICSEDFFFFIEKLVVEQEKVKTLYQKQLEALKRKPHKKMDQDKNSKIP